jgi:isoquinoline 1-oxidoreductase beta subunit
VRARYLFRLSRRELLLAGVGGGVGLGIGLYGGFRLGRRDERRRRAVPPREQPFAPGPFVAIDEAGLVTLWLSKTDVGQGVATSLPMIIADELGADPERLRVLQAPADDAYGNQTVAISRSVRGLFGELRKAGAAAREMLVGAAADALGVPPAECQAEAGFVAHPDSGRRLAFGALVRAAARRPVPGAPALRPRRELRFIGKRMPRLDLPAKIDGTARFGLDVRLAGMAFATIARCPTVGGKLVRFDAGAARTVPGVRDVLATGRGIAVVAEHTHAAILGREALRIEWDRGANLRWDSRAIDLHLAERLGQEGSVARREGSGAAGLAGEGRIVRAEYRLPYLAHATMEPMNCTADVRADGCTIFAPSQSPARVRHAAARFLGLPAGSIAVHVPLAGGAFGRRIEDDFVLDALEVSKFARRPVQVVWTREDDLRHDWYRPCSLHCLEARLSSAGLLAAWRHRIVAPSVLGSHDPGYAEPVDPTAVEGALELPYQVRHLQVEYVRAELPIPVGFWRSVGHSYNAFVVECFVDEIAAAADRDPVLLRRSLLAGAPRHLAVLDRAVREAGARPHGAGRGRGVAVHASFGSFVAMVADVTASADGSIAVDRVVCAADCGFAVHPDGVVAQIEGGIVYGLSAVLRGLVRFDAGAAAVSNFHDYPVLRFDQMPAVDVHLVDGDPEVLGGVGEIGVPPIAPAVCNAIFAATGRRVRALPLREP